MLIIFILTIVLTYEDIYICNPSTVAQERQKWGGTENPYE